MSPQIGRDGAMQLIDAILTDDVRVVNALIKALAKLGCSCITRTAEVDLDAHTCFCRYKMAMQDMELLP